MPVSRDEWAGENVVAIRLGNKLIISTSLAKLLISNYGCSLVVARRCRLEPEDFVSLAGEIKSKHFRLSVAAVSSGTLHGKRRGEVGLRNQAAAVSRNSRSRIEKAFDPRRNGIQMEACFTFH